MPNVTIRPIVDLTERTAWRGRDRVVSDVSATGATRYSIMPDGTTPTVTIDAFWDTANGGKPRRIVARLERRAHGSSGALDGLAVARVNRLLKGTGAPVLEWYHRTGELALKVPGKRLPLPATLDLYCDPVSGEWTVKVLGTAIAGPATPNVAVASPATPVTTGTIVPASSLAAMVTAPTVAGRVAARHARREANRAAAQAAREAANGVTASPSVDSDPTAMVKVAPAPALPVADRDPLGIFTFPSPSADSAILISEDDREVLRVMWAMHAAGDRQTLGLFGPTGTGKTSLVYDLAAGAGVGVYQMDAAGASTFMDWVGGTGATERNGASVTEYQPSALIEAIRADGPYAGRLRIILVDEVSRTESAAATNFLMTVTHDVPMVYVPDARLSIPIDPAALIVFTGNIGSAYNAAIPLDPALISRIGRVVWLDYPDRDTEVSIVADRFPSLDRHVATRLVDAAHVTRAMADRGELPMGVGTRDVLAAAKNIVGGLKPHVAAAYCWANKYSAEGAGASDRARVLSNTDGVLR